MTEVQKAAIDRANAKMAPALKLYELRNFVAHRVGLLKLSDLERLVSVLRGLSDANLRDLVDYAEGLAAWHDSAQSSLDDTTAKRAGDTPASSG